MNTILKVVCYWLLITLNISCDTNKSITNQEITSLEQALQQIDNYRGEAEDFTLHISLKKRLTDRGYAIPQTLAWIRIERRIKERGWMPNGYEEKNGIRIYKYKDVE